MDGGTDRSKAATTQSSRRRAEASAPAFVTAPALPSDLMSSRTRFMEPLYGSGVTSGAPNRERDVNSGWRLSEVDGRA
jgi:hypothetical protein